MTDKEWDKYVSKEARKIFVPEWGMFYVPQKVDKCTVFIQNDPVVQNEENPVLEEIKNETNYKEKLTYRTEYYKFKGKRYKKRFVERYERKEIK